jgi:c-di-GMP-binding flagellar brake protein YcgR
MDKQYNGLERRRFKRIRVNFTVVYNVNSPLLIRLMVGNKEIYTIAIDVSEDGMAIYSNYELPGSTIVTIKFVMLDDMAIKAEDRRKSIEVKGEVTSCVLTKERSYRLGIHFIDISAVDRCFLANFVKKTKQL